jgi:hypothetical protein
MEYKYEIKSALLVILFTIITFSAVRAQEDASDIAAAMAEIMALTDDHEASLLLEHLSDLREKPVTINSGDKNEIARLFFLTEFQVMVLVDHIKRNGAVVSLYELALLPAFDRSTVMLMAPYITLQPPAGSSPVCAGRTTVLMTAASRLTMADDDEGGIRTVARLRHEGSRLSYGVTAENDPGESFTFSNAPGPDFLSGYLMYRGTRFVDCIIAGDYSLRFGEGLAFNSSTWQTSRLSSPTFMTAGPAIAPYSSSDENSFFRGVSCYLGSTDAGAVLFASANMIDARLAYDGDSNAVAVTGLVKDGVHVTGSDLKARNSLTETVAGVHLSLGGEKIRGGLTSSLTWFSLPFWPDTARAENITSFTGNRLVNLAADIRTGTGPVLCFFETAVSLPGSWAVTGGLRAKPSARVTVNIVARHFSPYYYSFHSGAFRAGTATCNESGIAASLHLEVARHLFISAGADHYRVPWLRYRTSSPSCGDRIELTGEFLHDDNLSLRLSCISSSRDYDTPVDEGVAGSETVRRRVMALRFSFKPATNLSLTTRASISHVMPAREKGFLLCQDISFSLTSLPLKIWYRYALCTSDSYDSRLYAWENDLQSFYSIPALYGRCNRSFIMISWKPFDWLEARAKFVVIVAGTGDSRQIKQEVRAQGRLIF